MALPKKIDCVVMGKHQDSMIMGGRYHDGITNPNDPISLQEDILIDAYYKGSPFAFTQQFVFDWGAIIANTVDSQNQVVGRRTDGSILSQQATRGHIHRASVQDSNGDQRQILR